MAVVFPPGSVGNSQLIPVLSQRATRQANPCLLHPLAELLIGQKALVIEEIDTLSSKGRVEVRGQEWAAKTDAPEGKIPKNAIVVVEGIQGVKLIVRNGEETNI